MKGLRNSRTGARLSKSAHGNKRSALFHLFWCHDGLEGYPHEFERELASLFKGFTRVVQQHAQDDGEGDIGDGKEPMSPELYSKLCE